MFKISKSIETIGIECLSPTECQLFAEFNYDSSSRCFHVATPLYVFRAKIH